jgi:hypothetical protein
MDSPILAGLPLGTQLLRQSGGSHELAGMHCDGCGEAIRAEDDAVENLLAYVTHLESNSHITRLSLASSGATHRQISPDCG